MTYREVICSQQACCLSCPLSRARDCRELSEAEMRKIIEEVRDEHKRQRIHRAGAQSAGP